MSKLFVRKRSSGITSYVDALQVEQSLDDKVVKEKQEAAEVEGWTR